MSTASGHTAQPSTRCVHVVLAQGVASVEPGQLHGGAACREQVAQTLGFRPERGHRIGAGGIRRNAIWNGGRGQQGQLQDRLVDEMVDDGVAVVAGHRVARWVEAEHGVAALVVAYEQPHADHRVGQVTHLPERAAGQTQTEEMRLKGLLLKRLIKYFESRSQTTRRHAHVM